MNKVFNTVLLLAILSIALVKTANAQNFQPETEPNNSMETANLSSDGNGFEGTIGYGDDTYDYFAINIEKSGTVAFKVSNSEKSKDRFNSVTILDNVGTELGNISVSYIDPGEEYTSGLYKLVKGNTYYIYFRCDALDSIEYTLQFVLDTTETIDSYENNNKTYSAYPLRTDSLYARVGYGVDVADWYEIAFENEGVFQLKFSNPDSVANVKDGLGDVEILNSQFAVIKTISRYSIRDGMTYTTTEMGVVQNQTVYVHVKPLNEYSCADYFLEVISDAQLTATEELPSVPIPVNIAHEALSVQAGDTLLEWESTHPGNNPVKYSLFYTINNHEEVVVNDINVPEFNFEQIHWYDTVQWRVGATCNSKDTVFSQLYYFSAHKLVKKRFEINRNVGKTITADFDLDGDLDLLLQGSYNSNDLVELYFNVNGEFVKSDNSFEALDYGGVEIIDYDNDNDLDILVYGEDYNNGRTIMYRASFLSWQWPCLKLGEEK
jgi:hypothetical protein